MSKRSFSGIEEDKQSGGIKASTGIHDFKIVEIKVEEVKGKDSNPDWKKGKVVLECIKTIKGKDSVGKTIDYDILFPKDFDNIAANSKISDGEKLGKRLLHIFSKISTKDKIDTVKNAIKNLDLDSIDTLMAGLKKIADGRSLRLKIIGDKDRQFPVVPLFYAGYAETIDTNPTELSYDESNEGLLKKDSTKVESLAADESDLPF